MSVVVRTSEHAVAGTAPTPIPTHLIRTYTCMYTKWGSTHAHQHISLLTCCTSSTTYPSIRSLFFIAKISAQPEGDHTGPSTLGRTQMECPNGCPNGCPDGCPDGSSQKTKTILKPQCVVHPLTSLPTQVCTHHTALRWALPHLVAMLPAGTTREKRPHCPSLSLNDQPLAAVHR